MLDAWAGNVFDPLSLSKSNTYLGPNVGNIRKKYPWAYLYTLKTPGSEIDPDYGTVGRKPFLSHADLEFVSY